jgi:hypothetical protein
MAYSVLDEHDKLAKTYITQAVQDAESAAFEAGLAVPFLAGKYSEQRRSLAQEAQNAAEEAAEHAWRAEQYFDNANYAKAIEASHEAQRCFYKAREMARCAIVEESELYRCPNCLTRVERFSAKAHSIARTADGTRLWAKRFQCPNCDTPWYEIYTDANVLVERVIGERLGKDHDQQG